MTNTTSTAMGDFLSQSNVQLSGRQSHWLRAVVMVAVMTLLVLGMTPDGGRHIPVSTLEVHAKLILALGLGLITAGRLMNSRPTRSPTA